MSSVVSSVVVPAAVGGVVAYVTTWAQTRGEIKKLRAEQDEAHFSHRQSCYHDLLNAERKMHAILAEQELPNPVPKGWVEVKDRFRDCVNGVIISGSDEAVSAARRLDHFYFDGAIARGGTYNWDLRDRFRRQFVDAVRDDIGAPRPRP
jgi:hypothetical protein